MKKSHQFAKKITRLANRHYFANRHSLTRNSTGLSSSRRGFTSFYITIFASMLFTIIAVGFVSIVMSETTQTLNSQLSSSAYDSAMAGVEDAKLAVINCLGNSTQCDFLNRNPVGVASVDDCYAVARALDRDYTTETGVPIRETALGTDSSEEMLQAYTCVSVSNNLQDYRSYLSSTDSDNTRLVPLRSNQSDANETDAITGVRISWYATSDHQNNTYDFRNINGAGPVFGAISNGISRPPVIAVQLIQTDDIFTLRSEEIDYTVNQSGQDRTDRGLLFLVPAPKNTSISQATNHIASTGTATVMNGVNINTTHSASSGFAKANDKTKANAPYVVRCDESGASEFVCSVTIEIPQPVQYQTTDHLRNPTTSFLILSLPYGEPATDFAVELCTDGGGSGEVRGDCQITLGSGGSSTMNFVNAQYSIDSTGRANDVYRRIETRIEIPDTYFPYPQYAVHLTGGGNSTVLLKNSWGTYSGGYPGGCWAAKDGDVSNCPLNKTSGSL